jgi:hypothetical protein
MAAAAISGRHRARSADELIAPNGVGRKEHAGEELPPVVAVGIALDRGQRCVQEGFRRRIEDRRAIDHRHPAYTAGQCGTGQSHSGTETVTHDDRAHAPSCGGDPEHVLGERIDAVPADVRVRPPAVAVAGEGPVRSRCTRREVVHLRRELRPVAQPCVHEHQRRLSGAGGVEGKRHAVVLMEPRYVRNLRLRVGRLGCQQDEPVRQSARAECSMSRRTRRMPTARSRPSEGGSALRALTPIVIVLLGTMGPPLAISFSTRSTPSLGRMTCSIQHSVNTPTPPTTSSP